MPKLLDRKAPRIPILLFFIAAAWACLLSLYAPAFAAEVVTVDLSVDGGEILRRASGFLLAFSNDAKLPTDELVRPLKIRLHRTSPAPSWAQAGRMKDLGITQQVLISDGWGYKKEHPGDENQWAKWEEYVAKTVAEAQKLGLKPQWDIWNEPDFPDFWTRSQEQFNETWRRGWLKIRQLEPQAIIVGPSWSGVRPGQERFAAFIRYCKANKVMPDYVCWHFPANVLVEAQACRELLKAEQLQVKGLMVNEYCFEQEQNAGKTSWWLAQLERAQIDWSCHAIWNVTGIGTLDNVITDGAKGLPKGQWWVYQRYATLSGRLAATNPSGKIELVAACDEHGKTVQVLLGNAGGFTGDVTVHFQGLTKTPYLREGGRIHALVERIPEDEGKAVEKVQTLSETDLPAAGDALDVVVPWSSERDAFFVRLGPAKK